MKRDSHTPKPDSGKCPDKKRGRDEADSDTESQKNMSEPTQKEIEFDAGIVGHVQMVTSLIEGRRVSREEIFQMLVRAMRQHNIGRRRRIDYIVSQMNKQPP